MRVAALLVVLVVASGCGGDERPAGSLTPISVEEALALERGGDIAVQGSLIAAGGRARLCSGFAESHPPQCMEPSIVLHGLDVETVAGARREAATKWVDAPVVVIGRLAESRLAVREVRESR